ncbi:MAG: ATP-binding protein [Chthoniobacterales bacterium]
MAFSSPAQSRVVRYGAGAVAALITIGANQVASQHFTAQYPFMFLIAGVLFGAWFGGLGPGILVTALTALSAIVSPHFSGSPGSPHEMAFYFRLFVYLAESVLISLFCGSVRKREEKMNAVLAHRESTTGSLEERARLTRLEAEIGHLITQSETIEEVLQRCVQSLVRHVDAAFARIWTYNEAEEMLELQVSAGLYTHIDGPHGRVPLGQFKIGLIASEKKPHLTNQVIGDPRVNNQEWARRQKMVAFAGYPLLVGDRLYGVLAMFAQHRLSDATLSALALVSQGIALSLQRREGDQERARLLGEAQMARDAAEMANRAKDEFIATVSHELRTPLNAILGWARLLETGDLTKDEIAEASNVIERNARAQSQLIEDLLDVSRIVSGKLRLDLRTIDLPEVVRAAVRIIEPTATAKSINVQCVLDPRAGPISGDAERLQQIVWNLVSNAVKFTPKGGKVQVGLKRANSHVELTVSDNGMGIPTDFLPHIFERFTQAETSSTRSHTGLGLGLGITRHLIELQGGAIYAFSDGPGTGATFCVHLPILILHERGENPEAVHPRVPSDNQIDLCAELAGVRIVAVDDDPDARKLLQTVLTRCHAEVTVVANAAEALAAVKALRPDVLLSDIEMPNESGYDLIRQVRALSLEEGGGTPAAALTAYARAADRTQALRAGFQMHVPKPVEPSELIAVIANLAARGGASAAPVPRA